MGLRLIWGALALAGLTACGDRTHDYPALMPTAEMLAEPAIPAHVGNAARDDSLGPALEARGKALAGQAGGPPMAGTADLQARADTLRARAKTLSQQSLDAEPDAETCPADQPDCASQSAQE
jgi:hypothetical protein